MTFLDTSSSRACLYRIYKSFALVFSADTEKFAVVLEARKCFTNTMNESCQLANTSTILLNVCMYAHCMHFQHKIDESHKMLHHYKFISGFVVTTMHSGATHLLIWGHRKNICCKKIFGNSFRNCSYIKMG